MSHILLRIVEGASVALYRHETTEPARKSAGAAAVATKILPSDRAQLKLPGLPRTRKPARTVGASA
ncbi:hypothetical protein [Xanthomonas oryzae]|uniref:hypothetical protein n=1 Tax=Xanthomonas oryzae TaxID=347 RepID=UPI0015EF5AF7|nr:hypothetical protein [Xanthomonas oryzae]